jgi:hypothetical protein
MKLATGVKGKSFNDRELAGRVRTLALTEIEKVLLQKENSPFKEAVILRLAGSLLPRLNEVTGADGTPLILPSELIAKNETSQNPSDSRSE